VVLLGNWLILDFWFHQLLKEEFAVVMTVTAAVVVVYDSISLLKEAVGIKKCYPLTLLRMWRI